MPLIDPAAAACQTIAAHLGALAGIAEAREGWSEHHQGHDPSAGPSATVTHLFTQRTLHPPVRVSAPPEPSLYRIADLVHTAQLDLWAASKIARENAVPIIESGLHNLMPRKHGLYLSLVDYWGRPITAVVDDYRADDDPSDAEIGEWRRRWRLKIWADLVVEAATPLQAETILQTEVAGTAEPDHTSTP